MTHSLSRRAEALLPERSLITHAVDTTLINHVVSLLLTLQIECQVITQRSGRKDLMRAQTC
jgi:hypothetical protein